MSAESERLLKIVEELQNKSREIRALGNEVEAFLKKKNDHTETTFHSIEHSIEDEIEILEEIIIPKYS